MTCKTIPPITLLCFLLASGCAHEMEWQAVDEGQLWARCTGRIVALSVPPSGLVVVRVKPRAEDVYLLSEGDPYSVARSRGMLALRWNPC